MKKISNFTIVFLFIALCLNTYGQEETYSYKVNKSGSGDQAIIFIPDLACSPDVWNETKALFEDKYTCYTITLAGFAGVKAQNKPQFKWWSKVIAKFIEDNKIGKPIIICHSLGGGLAMAIAADYPDLLSKIIVVNTLPCLSALLNPTFKSKENTDCGKHFTYITSLSDEQFYQLQKKTIPSLLADTTMHELVISWSMKTDRHTFAELYCDFMNTDLREKIKRITCPTLILLEANFISLKPSIEEQYKNLKTAQLEYSKKGLHFVMFDDKQWYFEQLNKFLTIK